MARIEEDTVLIYVSVTPQTQVFVVKDPAFTNTVEVSIGDEPD